MSEIIAILIEMGFSKTRAEQAVASTGSQDVQTAMDWILSNEEETAPATTVETLDTSVCDLPEKDVEQEESSQQEAKSIKCDDCGKLFKDHTDVEVHASKTVEDLKMGSKKLQDARRQALLKRKTISGNATKKIMPWKYEPQKPFFLSLTVRKTQSNVNESEEEGEHISVSGESETEEEEQETVSELQNKRKCVNFEETKDKVKRNTDKECDVDKIIAFMQENSKNKQPSADLDFFFASACESTKRLPRRLQLRVKQEVMKVITDAEMEFMDSESVISGVSSNTNC